MCWVTPWALAPLCLLQGDSDVAKTPLSRARSLGRSARPVFCDRQILPNVLGEQRQVTVKIRSRETSPRLKP